MYNLVHSGSVFSRSQLTDEIRDISSSLGPTSQEQSSHHQLQLAVATYSASALRYSTNLLL